MVKQNLDLPSRASAPLILIATACSLALLPRGASAGGHIRGDLPAGGTLQRVFATAASEFHVPEEVLLAVLDRQPPDPAAALLDTLSVDSAAVRQRLTTPPSAA